MGGMGGLTLNYKMDDSNITYKVATNFNDVTVGLDMEIEEYPVFTIADLPVKLYWGVGGDVGTNFNSVTVDAGAYAGLRVRYLENWEIFAPQLGLKPSVSLPVAFNLFNFVGEAGFRYWF